MIDLFFVAILVTCIYGSWILLNNGERRYRILSTRLDEYVPLVSIFIYPYLSFLIFVPLTMVLVALNKPSLLPAMFLAFGLGCLIASAFYVFFQTYVQRPDVVEKFRSHKIINLMYEKSKSFNAFPSTHVLYTVLATLFLVDAFPSIAFFANTYATVVCASTVFTKQHYILDILGGFVIAVLVYSLAFHVF
jgi:membrane-associated phospholipid phosphatase